MSISIQNKWPDLNYDALKDTIATVQLWTQIIGKIRLNKMPWTNHSWHVTLYVSSKGLTTGSTPFGKGIFELEFDFVRHELILTTSEGANTSFELYPRSVASFYSEVFEKLEQAGVHAEIFQKPNEVEPATLFDKDHEQRAYDKKQIFDYWQALVLINNVFTQFRAGFTGKCSPVHFFWGAFDLAVTRFSGREATKFNSPVTNIPLRVMQEAYSHEVCSAGFWGGSPNFPQPAFYAYCYPSPADFGVQPIEPEEAFFSKEMGEFLLPYHAIRDSPEPEAALMQFLQSTYDAAAKTANWDRQSLDFKFATGI